MSGFRLSIQVLNGGKIIDQLDAAAAMARSPVKAAQAAAEWMTGETFRIFEAGYNVDGPWQPLSKVTRFLRKHRANYPRNSDTPGSDTGRLKGSFVPDWNQDGTQFGAGTNVNYAKQFDQGGPSKPNVVAIGAFTRRRPGSAIALLGGKTRHAGGGPVKVRSYLMHMKENQVPARPFYPKDIAELESWGYVDKIRQIFALKFNEALGK